jgi:hypothetical protein
MRPLCLPDTASLDHARSLPTSALERPGGVGDGAPPGAVRAWIGLSGRFLALAICTRRAPRAGIRGYGSRRLR